MIADDPPPRPCAHPAGAVHGSFASRTVSAVLIASAFAALLWADSVGLGGAAAVWWLLPLAAVVALGGIDEMARLLASRGIVLPAFLLRPAVLAMVLAPLAGGRDAAEAAAATMGWPAVVAAIAVAALCGAEVAVYGRRDGVLERLSASVFTLVLLGLPLACMVSLRLVCSGEGDAEQAGPGHAELLPLVSLVAVAKAGDVAAYAVGSLVGRHRMAPVLSPGKTWEGAAGSLAGSVAAAWLVLGRGGGPPVGPWGGWPVFGLLVGLAAMLGDLAESLVKRECGAKDSGRSLGGLGGVLDLVDSLLFAAPVAWMLWVLAAG